MEFTNLEAKTTDGRRMPQATIHVRRIASSPTACSELLRVRNYHNEPGRGLPRPLLRRRLRRPVRGARPSAPPRRGTLARAEGRRKRSLTLAYLGLDDVLRKTVITFDEMPESIHDGRVRFRLKLAPRERSILRFDIEVVAPGAPEPVEGDFNDQLGRLRRAYDRWAAEATDVFTDNEQFTARAAPRAARPAHAARRAPRAARCRWRACRGSWRPSAATRSSPASRR